MPRRAKRKRKSAQHVTAFVASVLDDLKAEKVRILDVRHLTSIMDVMIIASGRSDRHVRAVADSLVERCEAAGIPLLGVEGQEGGEWVLVDLADVVVHVMLPRTRAFYEIEKLWDISSAETESAEHLHL
ncbi:MAG TPA: ribosome silencing factor [Gammaproteobacteria bacterium]